MAGPVILRSGASFRVDVTSGDHSFIADEPFEAGGTDQGPTPYDLISAGLGACTSMTLHFVAKRDGIPLEGVEISITTDRMYAKDCADCETTTGYIHRFDVQIRLKGNLTPEQRQRLLDTAHRCPIYKTLTNEIRIVETLID
ncbi:MAG TPA: OsmC family protein [Thermoanaerobaculia bacterium]|nr:OsmC family protein [Thermoanaerobaculia bacterium]